MIGSADARRAALYRSLAAFESAGVPFRDALDRVGDPVLDPARVAIEKGASIADGFAGAPAISRLEAKLVAAGEKGGRLPEVFRTLEGIFEGRARLKRQLALDLSYPLLLLHLAFLLPRVSVLVTTGVSAYLRVAFGPILILWAVIAASAIAFELARKATPRVVDGTIDALPILGPVVRARSYVAAITALSAVYEAGVPIVAAVDAGAEAAPSSVVADRFRAVGRALESGATIGDAFLSVRGLPPILVEAARTGEKTGKLDALLQGAKNAIEQEAEHKRAIAMRVLPVFVFLIVASYIGYIVIDFYVGNLNRALNGFK
jgi:type II secretory pathway component PulF